MTRRRIGLEELEDLAIGAAVLGTGGGGDPYVGKLWAQQRVLDRGPVELIDVDEVADDALVVAAAMMGAPSVIVEKIPSGSELLAAFRAVEQACGARADVVMCIEAGGINSTIPFAVAADLGLPVVDGDGMGRAFPEVQMVSFAAHGLPATPMAVADELGNVTLLRSVSAEWAERLGRALVVAEGGASVIAQYPIRGRDLKLAAIRGTLTLALQIGAGLRRAGRQSQRVIEDLTRRLGGALLFHGKIVDLRRETASGFVRGAVSIDGLDRWAGSSCQVTFQNENLIAIVDGTVRASVPDLITLLEEESAHPVTTERLRFGMRVFVLALPCAPLWREPRGLAKAGPRCFGLDLDYVPFERRLARS
ncbi:MAG TPA: DUF917 domain-containing protein [Acidimicrobiales bacterium]|nr:DUF917 domain-containing protein [Acidimicrobiales bacterium]